MNHNRYLVFILLAMVLLGCSTRRNTWLSRGYQNLTSRYNVLFNGLQSFEEGRAKMRESMADDYTTMLPLFAYSVGSGASVASSQMERAISKGNKLIKDHSITVKPNRKPKRGDETYEAFYNQREFNRWVDDAWMLIGKAHVYQREWPEAIYAFEMLLRDFPDHPARFEALLWMARAYIEAGQEGNAQLMLNRYESDGEAPNRFYGDFMATYARFWLAKKQYSNALPYCTAAAENAGNRWDKIRRIFVLGQVCDQLGLVQQSKEAFKKVVSLNPDYDMGLFSGVQVALLEGGREEPALARQQLNKYLRQSKNREFRDQLYFAMADTWFWEKDTLKALTQLKLAAGYSQGNQTLKGKIYLKMADVYLDTREYIAAHAYYDSALVMLPEGDPRLGQVKKISGKLAPLSMQLQVIEHEDSVQRIAMLPSAERDVFLENLLAMYQQEQDQGAFDNTADDAFFFRNLSNRGNQTTDDQGNWYFYNQTMVSLGKMEFEKRWGRRPLADDWRRLDKKTQSAPEEEREVGMMPSDPFGSEAGPGGQGPGGQGPGGAKELGPVDGGVPDKQSLLDGLPLTPEKMEASRLRVEEAMYGAGIIFYDQLEKYSESQEMLNKLLLGFPATAHREQALMVLYLACEHLEDAPCVAQRKEQYLTEFPGTRFGDYLTDPDYLEKEQAHEGAMNKAYREAYSAYQAGDWETTIVDSRRVIEGHFEKLKPTASLLMAMAYGRKGATDQFETGLSEVVANYQGSPEASLAGEWLGMLNEGRLPVKINSVKSTSASAVKGSEDKVAPEFVEEQSGFVLKADSAHYLLMVVSPQTNINQLMFNVADYNFERFLIGDYQLKTQKMADGTRVLQVGPFPNKNIGMDYYFSVRDNTDILKGSQAGGSTLLLISDNNLKRLLLSGDLPAYQAFFLEQYLPTSEASAVEISQREVPVEEVAPEPEDSSDEQVTFSVSEGPMLGMVVIPSKSGNKKRTLQFLPNYVRNIVAVSISVVEQPLADGTVVVLIKTFEGMADFNKLKEALIVNPYWKSQLAGDDWSIYPVSDENFKLIMEQGSVQDYVEFIEGSEGNK